MRKMLAAWLMLGAVVAAVPAEAKIEKTPWGETADHRKIDLYTLTNANGMQARIATYGAYLVSLQVPDRNGKLADVVLGYDKLKDYMSGTTYGAVIGRFANRIGGAQFTLEGKTYHLAANAGPNNIHGGPKNFTYHVYDAVARDGASPSLTLHMVSPAGDRGFPGKLDFTVTYTVIFYYTPLTPKS